MAVILPIMEHNLNSYKK